MTTPLNLEVEATLELEILSGRIPPGQKLPSIRVLAGQWETELGQAAAVRPCGWLLTRSKSHTAVRKKPLPWHKSASGILDSWDITARK